MILLNSLLLGIFILIKLVHFNGTVVSKTNKQHETEITNRYRNRSNPHRIDCLSENNKRPVNRNMALYRGHDH